VSSVSIVVLSVLVAVLFGCYKSIMKTTLLAHCGSWILAFDNHGDNVYLHLLAQGGTHNTCLVNIC
jgi:hypothetical protein